MATDSVDLVVVGGGLVGATRVHALRHSHLRVAWIERQPVANSLNDPRSTALAHASARLLDDLGLWPAVCDAACAIDTVSVSQQGHFGSVSLEASDMGVAALGYVLPNRVLAGALAGRIAEQTGLTVIAPDSVESLTQDDAGVSLQLSSGRVVQARLVVAADGVQSQVRLSADIPVRRELAFEQHAVVAELTAEQWPDGLASERFCSYGPLALLPLGADRLSLVYTVPDIEHDRVMALSDTDFLSEIQRRTGDSVHFMATSPRQSFPLVAVSADACWRDRVVLIGNAVRTLHPVAGQGFNLALRDCLSLAELLLELGPGADPAEPSVASRYIQRRRTDQQATALATEAFARLFRGDSTLLGHLRGLGLLLTDRVSPLRRQLARQFMGLGGRLPNIAPVGTDSPR